MVISFQSPAPSLCSTTHLPPTCSTGLTEEAASSRLQMMTSFPPVREEGACCFKGIIIDVKVYVLKAALSEKTPNPLQRSYNMLLACSVLCVSANVLASKLHQAGKVFFYLTNVNVNFVNHLLRKMSFFLCLFHFLITWAPCFCSEHIISFFFCTNG